MKRIFSTFFLLLSLALSRVWFKIKPVFLIFGHDVRTIFKNRSTIVIIMGLCFLPSLYAWINIYACWDPYARTGNLPVAIVSKDQGTVFNGKIVNVGSDVIAELKNNKSIGWDFVDEWQANYGLNDGKYYALIELPENFSERLTTLSTATPQKPVITYRVNEKLNSIATKITDAAKTKLVENIKTNFVKSVTEDAMNTLKIDLESSDLSMSDIGTLKDALSETSDDITKLKDYISQANTNSQNYQKFLKECSDKIPKVNSQISSLQNIIAADKSLAQNTERTIETISSDLSSDISQLSILDSYNRQFISLLREANDNGLQPDTIAIMENCSSLCSSTDALLQSDIQNLKSLAATYSLPSLTLAAESLEYIDNLVLNEKAALDQEIPILSANTSSQSVDAALKSLSALSSEITDRLTKASGQIQNNAIPTLKNLINDFEIELTDIGTIAELGRNLIPQLSALSAFSAANSTLTQSQGSELSGRLSTIQEGLDVLLSKINSISGDDISKLESIMQSHPDNIADFLSSPINVKEVDIYSTSTFGVGVTPFYTVLAIWIGALLGCALLAVESRFDEIGGYTLNLAQQHFGKMLLFLCISLVQSTIITLGDVFLLGVHPANFPLMLAMSALTSVTFTVIIFTLVSLFGNVGKAIAVVMMVFQIAGAGGIYPIQTNPEIFGLLAPLWPFSYAIEYFREAIAGPVMSSVSYNVHVMLIFIAAFLLLELLKKRLHNLNKMFEHIYKQAKI